MTPTTKLLQVLTPDGAAVVGAIMPDGSAGTVQAALEAIVQTAIEAVVPAATAAAVASALRAETAADAAELIAGVFDTIAQGISNTTSGKYFSIPDNSNGSFLTLYKNNAGVELLIGSYPNAKSVREPSWAGKKNGWPDPFFREFDLRSQNLLGVDRWWCAAGTASDRQSPLEQGGWSRLKNTLFNGYMLRRTANVGTTPLNGPVVVLADMDVVEGETVTLYQLFSGDGAVISALARFDNGNDRGYVGAQFGLTTDSGGPLVAAQLPSRAKTTIVVPPGAKRLTTYAYTSTPNKTFDLLAMWAFKGTVTDGPSWPTLSDSIVNDYKVSQLISRVDLIQPAADYLVESYTNVESDSEAIALNGTGFTSNPRNLVFMGWGETYAPAGVSFNALRVKAISRTAGATAKWKTLHCVVKTGVDSFSNLGVVVARGSVTVLETPDTLTDITFVLKDPVTGNNKTLTDADFTSGQYFIGVWALTAKGQPAACGEPRGVMANSLLQAYYHQSSVNKPIDGTWNVATAGANIRQAFQHLRLVAPVENTTYVPSQGLLLAVGANTGIPIPELVAPDKMHGVEGQESNLYFDNLFLGESDDYYIDVTATEGRQQNERLTWIPTGALTNGTITVSVFDKRTGALLTSATIQQRAAAASAGAGKNLKCLFVGDSLIESGYITQTMLNTAAGDSLKLTMLGTLGTAPNNREGRGGWTIARYLTAESPFVFDGSVNFTRYLTTNGIATPDWVFIHLGINDVFGQTSDAGASVASVAAFAAFDTLIQSIRAAGSGIKIGVITPTPPSRNQDAFGTSYLTAQVKWRFKRNILIFAREHKKYFSNKEVNNIYVVPSNVALDTTNNMKRAAAAPVNSRSPITVSRQSDGVHPDQPGYAQIGDAITAFLKCNV